MVIQRTKNLLVMICMLELREHVSKLLSYCTLNGVSQGIIPGFSSSRGKPPLQTTNTVQGE